MKIPTIRFIFDRKHVSTKTKKGAIDLAITYNYQRKIITTGVRCYSWQWDDTKKCIKGTPDAIILNNIITTMHKKTLQVIQDMVEAGRIDIAAIPTILKGNPTRGNIPRICPQEHKQERSNHSCAQILRSILQQALRIRQDNHISRHQRKEHTTLRRLAVPLRAHHHQRIPTRDARQVQTIHNLGISQVHEEVHT